MAKAALFSKFTKKDAEVLKGLLTFIVQHTQTPTGYAMAPESEVAKIQKYHGDLVEVLPTVAKDAAGNIGVRATAAGIAAINGTGTVQTVTAGDVAKVSAATLTGNTTAFIIEKGITLPPAKRGFGNQGPRPEKYPFSQMEVGDSIGVLPTAEMPEPWKTLASAVSGATRKYAVKTDKTKAGRKEGVTIPVYRNTRVFTVRRMPAGIYNGKELPEHARIFRDADAS